MPSTVRLTNRRLGPLVVLPAINTRPCVFFSPETNRRHVSEKGFVVYLGRRRLFGVMRHVAG